MARGRRRFTERRRMVGLSQEQLAEAVGVERTTVGRWETAESSPQPAQRPRLARALGVTLDELHDLLVDVVDGPDRDLVPTAPAARRSLHPDDVTDNPDWPTWFGVRVAYLWGMLDDGPDAVTEAETLQTLFDREFQMFEAMAEDRHPAHELSRRQALVTMAALPLAVTRPRPGPEFLSRCAASLTACWHLLRGKDLATVDHVVTAYLLSLDAVARSVGPHRQTAARLAAQAHRICGIVALHRDRLRMREYHCRQALHFAAATEDASGQVAALISLASTHFYDTRAALSAETYQQALALESAVPPVQRSRIHAELAVAYAQLGREHDALSAAGRAEELYPASPYDDPSFLYAEFTPASLTLERGLSYLALAERFPGRHISRWRRTSSPMCTCPGGSRFPNASGSRS
jgi:transcriptional regulator with XRE-family HTH domain